MNLFELETNLHSLRTTWPNKWLGLPNVIGDCLKRLGHDAQTPLTAEDASIYRCILRMGEMIEEEGLLKSLRNEELHYHNRLHIADAVYALTCLLLAARACESKDLNAPMSHAEWVAMLCIVAHDYAHTGSINEFPSQIEIHTYQALSPLMQQDGVAPEDQDAINHIIMKTDPLLVSQSHAEVKDLPFLLSHPLWMTVLIQESDILASSLPNIGIDLTVRLSNEWAALSADRAQALLKPSSRVSFLQKQALFSSPASHYLGIQALVAQEVEELNASDVTYLSSIS